MRDKQIGFFDKAARTVIPRWRPFQDTVNIDGQLDCLRYSGAGQISDVSGESEYIKAVHEFRSQQSVWFAGDLLADAIARNDEPIVAEVSDFVLRANSGASETLSELAGKPKRLTYASKEDAFRHNVSALRKRLSLYPHTALGWVDLSYYFTLAGKLKAADRAMRVALQLAPENRFVLRSAARFYIHVGEPDRAYALLSKSNATPYDPWLMAGEIASASAANRRPRFIKAGRQMVHDGSYSPHHVSELASAIGTVLIDAGMSRREMKAMFKASLQGATENSLAQAEWASRQNTGVPLPDFHNRVDVSEARSWQYFVAGEYQETLTCAYAWLADQPFSARPVQLIAWIESSLSDRYTAAIDMLKAAELPNPTNAMILNNLAFAYASRDENDDLILARRYNERSRREERSDEQQIFSTATSGLIAYREGSEDEGRELYLGAIETAMRPGIDERIAPMAWMYFAREECRAGGPMAATAILNARLSANKFRHKDVQALLEHLEPTFSVSSTRDPHFQRNEIKSQIGKEGMLMRKGTHKVSFVAEVPKPTRISFKTEDGERVSFVAKKERPQKVTFWAKNSPRRKD